MQLSPHFSLAELTVSDTAARLGIDNTPDVKIIANLQNTAAILERVRVLVAGNRPIIVTSGYRCLALNRAIGSADTSAHVLGMAADFHVEGISPLDMCRLVSASVIPYDQCIFEFASWTHLAWGPGKRRQNLTIDSSGTRLGF